MKYRALCLGMVCLICVPLTSLGQEKPAAPFANAPFVPVPKGELKAPPQIDYGKGGCEPIFADGSKGTCINDRPCNGFGFRDPDGKLVCRCFDNPSCNEGFVCSARWRTCVRPRNDSIAPIR